MRDVAVIGVGAHPAGKYQEKALKDLGRKAIWNALKDAGIAPEALDVAYIGNSLAGLLTGQEGIRGQVVTQDAGIGGIPVINVENACASGATAFRGAWLEVASGAAELALAVGVEKMFVGDLARSISALAADSELDLSRMGMQFSATYAIHPKINLKGKMHDYGWTVDDYAKVVVKNSYNGSLNPYAQHRRALSTEEVLRSRMIADRGSSSSSVGVCVGVSPPGDRGRPGRALARSHRSSSPLRGRSPCRSSAGSPRGPR